MDVDQEAFEAAHRLEADGFWTEPVRGGPWDPATIGMPGLDRLRAFVRGDLPTPPITYLTGMVPVEAGVGTLTGAMPATENFMGPSRRYLGGTLALLADAALAGAIISGLPPGLALTTQELSLHFLRQASPDSEKLIARGHVIHGGRSIGLSEVHIHDSHGRLLGYGSSRCVTIAVDVPPSKPSPASKPDADWVPPYKRAVRGGMFRDADAGKLDGLEFLETSCTGGAPWPPFAHMLGIRPVRFERGSATLWMPASPWMMNPGGTVYGGALALLADTVLDWAATTMLPRGASFMSLDLKVNFLRPVRPDGRRLTARSQVFHAGKQMVVATADIVDAEGRQVVVATGTRMIMQTPWKGAS